MPAWELFKNAVRFFYETGMITNGPVVRQLEIAVEDTFRISHAVAVSSCTSGLMLVLKCLGIKGKVAIPSFTFFATAHAVGWNGLEPVFVDIDEETWTLSPASLEEALREHKDVVAVMPVHTFGNPCEVERIDTLAKEKRLAVIYDAAHAMGSKVGEDWVGTFGDAEVFSLSPTKMVVAGEGGIIATRDSDLAGKLRAGRDYGNAGDYDPVLVGLNARMSEFHAALAVESFKLLELNVRRRNSVAERYKAGLSDLPGLRFQKIKQGNRSTYKDFTVLIGEEEFGLNRDVLAWYLLQEGIDTRKYYNPPVHRTKAYWEKWGQRFDEYLPATNRVSSRVISLPIWSHMEMSVVDLVCQKIREAHEGAGEVKRRFDVENP